MRLVIECAGKKVEYPLTESTVIVGRENTCDIYFPEPSLSRRHLMCSLHGHELTVRDLNSKNGTFFGPQRVQEARLLPGVRLRAGNCFIYLMSEEEDGATTAAAEPTAFRLQSEVEPAPPPVIDLESQVPDDENFAEEEEPTPVDDNISDAVAATEDNEARLLVREGRWFVQDPATGVEIEIVPLQGAPNTDGPSSAGEAAALPVLSTGSAHAAALPALRGEAVALTRIQAVALPAASPAQGWLGTLLADPKKRWYLIGTVALVAVLAVLASVLFKPKPPPPPISVGRYRHELNQAITQYSQGDSQEALATLDKLRKMPLNFKPFIAEMMVETITADMAMAKDFAKGYSDAQKRWKELRDDSKTPAELRKIAQRRALWINSEEGNFLSLNEAKRYAENGDYARARAYAANVSEDSMFHKEAAPIVRQAHEAVIKRIIDRAETAVRQQKWQDAVAAYEEAIDTDDSLAAALKPKITLYERYERERKAYEQARSMAANDRHADALRQLNAIAKDSPYAENAASLRSQCNASGSNQAAQAAYTAGNGRGALDTLEKAGMKSSGLYSRIQRILEKQKEAQQAQAEGRFQTAENAWRAIISMESNKDNAYVKEAARELQYIPERKNQMSGQYVREADTLLEQFQFKSARKKFTAALLLNAGNQGAVDGLNQLRKRAQLEYNLAINERESNPKKALARLQIAADCLSPTDRRFQDIETLVKRIREEMKEGNP